MGRGQGFRRGSGRGQGFGRGWRNWFRITGRPFWQRQQDSSSAAAANNAGADSLETQIDKLQREIDLLKKQIADYDKR
jgi:hypothetical protein